MERVRCAKQRTTLAAPHKARATVHHLEGDKLQVLPHPPYSPDLAPCDFGLFSTSKTDLAGKKCFFANSRSCKSGEFTTSCHNPFCNATTPSGKWLRQLQLCENSNCEYFALQIPENVIVVRRFVFEL